MLPDFPDLKAKLARVIEARMRRVHTANAPMWSNGFVHIHEGNQVFQVDEDGLTTEVPMKLHQATVSFKDDEVESLTPEEIFRRFDDATREIAEQSKATFFESLDRTVEVTGNKLQYKGKPTGDDILAMLETILIEFDEHGRPHMPSILCGKDLFRHFRELASELEGDVQHKKQLDRLLARKREQWRDRESSRKLVE